MRKPHHKSQNKQYSDEVLEETHERIRAAREDAGYSQIELAKRIGIGRTKFQAIENGSATLNVDDLVKLSEVTGKHISFFMPKVNFSHSQDIYTMRLDATAGQIANIDDQLSNVSKELTEVKELVISLVSIINTLKQNN